MSRCPSTHRIPDFEDHTGKAARLRCSLARGHRGWHAEVQQICGVAGHGPVEVVASWNRDGTSDSQRVETGEYHTRSVVR